MLELKSCSCDIKTALTMPLLMHCYCFIPITIVLLIIKHVCDGGDSITCHHLNGNAINSGPVSLLLMEYFLLRGLYCVALFILLCVCQSEVTLFLAEICSRFGAQVVLICL